jgi:hypothetical protein
MMPRAIKVAPLPEYRLHVEFDDGVSAMIDPPARNRERAGRKPRAPALIGRLYVTLCGEFHRKPRRALPPRRGSGEFPWTHCWRA